MKQSTVTLAAAVLLASAVAYPSIHGSAHDFANAHWSVGETCSVCHAMVDDKQVARVAPLWNREMPSGPWIAYSSPTLDAGRHGRALAPSGLSKLCLSCHDGTVALDSFGGRTGNTRMAASKRVGPDLSSHHPVSITYDARLALKDRGLHQPTSPTALGGTIDSDLLYEEKLECSSCHDVHNTGATPGPGLLRISNHRSALCLTCHDK